MCYECLSAFPGYHQFCCMYCWESDHLYYCSDCYNCSFCFGCSSLKRKQYCIFNVQLTPEEYSVEINNLYDQMQKTGEWGEFFPAEFSPFGYNETAAQEFFH